MREYLLGLDQRPRYFFPKSDPRAATERIAEWWQQRVFGYTYTDCFIAVAFEILDEHAPIVPPITAFEPSED